MVSEKNMVENREERPTSIKEKKLGGIKTVPFILANELCDRLASLGFHANLITYLTHQLNLPLVKASNILANFGATAALTLLAGALVADSFAGRFWTIFAGSIIFEVGLISITASAVLPQLRPPPCPTRENCTEASALQLWALYLSLVLTYLGSAGIRPCVITFAADQFDMSKSKVESRRWNLFNWYYFCLGISMLLSLTVIVYIQDHVGWGWGLGIPTIIMLVSIIAFVVGSPLYKKVKPGGSPLVRLAQVIVAAVRKWKAVAPADPTFLYENTELDAAISTNGRLLHTNQFKWLDRGAIVTNQDPKELNKPNLWRVVTVHRVEELKTILRMLPIWLAATLLAASASHQNSFTIEQARTMERHITPTFEIPPASMSLFSWITMVVGIPLYEHIFVPVASKITGNRSGITCLQRIGVGYAINILATIVSALAEMKRRASVIDHNLLDSPIAIVPISVFWLVPQFFLQGLADVFASAANLEFIYNQSPESMRSTLLALYWVTASMGNYIGSFIVSSIHKYTGKESNWLPDRNINKARLDYYYWLATGIQVINLVYYIVCARFYTYKPFEEINDRNKDQDIMVETEKNPSNLCNEANGNNVV